MAYMYHWAPRSGNITSSWLEGLGHSNFRDWPDRTNTNAVLHAGSLFAVGSNYQKCTVQTFEECQGRAVPAENCTTAGSRRGLAVIREKSDHCGCAVAYSVVLVHEGHARCRTKILMWTPMVILLYGPDNYMFRHVSTIF